ncbi:MAG: hypothetical protein WBO00_07005 [Steroidobacteraceae bacterium]
MTNCTRLLVNAVLVMLAASLPAAIASAQAPETPQAKSMPFPADAELEAQGARIGNVTILVKPIFDPEKPGENKALFRLADKWHMDSRESAISPQLLFKPGDPYSRRILDETERNLRDLRFIHEPAIRVSGYHDGLVDLEVIVHDVWTLNPGVSYGRTGGKDSGGISFQELNLLGYGKRIAIDYRHNVDRNSYTLTWVDPNVLGSRWQSEATITDSDDGTGQTLLLERPFFSLNTRRSAGVWFVHDDAIQNVYRLGDRIAEYQRNRQDAEIKYGWSGGLQDGWTRRWLAGLRRESAEFALVPDATAPAALPGDRDLRYPFLRLEAIEDDFETTRNLDQIARTEDLHFGWRYALELGWAATALGSDRDAAILRADLGRGFRLGDRRLLFIGSSLTGRLESGSAKDALFSASLRYYHPTGQHSTFFVALTGDAGQDLDADHELVLGGEEGLRGYPLRYQTGDTRAILTIEQRYYTKYSLWKIADIGGAVFFDIGRTWGNSAFGPTENQGMLKDIGFGLRLGNTRSALGNVLHLDVAFPLDGDSSIDSVQFLVQTKRTF